MLKTVGEDPGQPHSLLKRVNIDCRATNSLLTNSTGEGEYLQARS